MRHIIRTSVLLFILAAHLESQVVVTIYPLKSILEEILPDFLSIHCLVPAAASPHTYEMVPSDLRITEASRILVYVGEDLDQWAEKIPDIKTLALLPLIPDSLRLYPDHYIQTAFNPHFWTDPLLVFYLLPAMSESLCVIFPEYRNQITENTAKFSSHLRNVDSQIQVIMQPFRGKAVFMSHPFFEYFLKRYGLLSAGVIEEIPGKEPSAKSIQRLIRMAKTRNVQAILTHRQLADRPAFTISEAANIPLIDIDPLGGTGGRERYEDMLIHNAHRLAEGLR